MNSHPVNPQSLSAGIPSPFLQGTITSSPSSHPLWEGILSAPLAGPLRVFLTGTAGWLGQRDGWHQGHTGGVGPRQADPNAGGGCEEPAAELFGGGENAFWGSRNLLMETYVPSMGQVGVPAWVTDVPSPTCTVPKGCSSQRAAEMPPKCHQAPGAGLCPCPLKSRGGSNPLAHRGGLGAGRSRLSATLGAWFFSPDPVSSFPIPPAP